MGEEMIKTTGDETVSRNFIEREIDRDLAEGVYDHVCTRFPPEPNGYLHIGHAKSIVLNSGIAKEYNGTFHLRFDDTNPTKEKTEFVDSIKQDVEWLGADFGGKALFASDYFDIMYEKALLLIKKGKAYVSDLSADEIREYRGDFNNPGKESPYRNRSVEETYRLLQDIADMKKGEIAIAYTPEQGSRMFSHIYPIFHRMYPDITFKIYEARVKQGEQLLLRGSVNIAFVSHALDDRKPQFDYFLMSEELLVFGVPKSHPLAPLAGERSWEAFPPIDFHLLRDEPVILVSKETRLRDMVDTLYEAAGVKPRILFESASSITAFNMVKSQVAPAFFPQSYVTPTAPIAYFSVGSRMRWMRSALTRKDAYISKAEQDFLKLAKDYVQCQQGCEG